MNENNKNTSHFTAEDIRRYLKGQMSAEEMHAIEIAALDDPFLADAIEGYQGALAGGDEAAINAGLSKVNKQLQERIKQPPKVSSIAQNRWWNIAAAALILVVAGIAFYNNRMNSGNDKTTLAVKEKSTNDSSDLAKAEEKPASPTTQSDTQSTTIKSNNDSIVAPAAPSSDVVSTPLSARSSNESVSKPVDKKESDTSRKASGQKDELDAQQNQRLEKQKVEAITSAADNNVREKQSGAVASTPAERLHQLASRQNNFSGRVVDQDNKPLASASVTIVQNNTSATTDENGSFSLPATDSVVEVQVGMIGYETRKFRLRDDLSSNKLVLEAGGHLEEVVVVGYGRKRKQPGRESTAEGNGAGTLKKPETKATVKVQGAVPLIGWVEYQKYLDKNKRPPSSNPLLIGEVVVSFQVRRTGMLSDFKVEKSLAKDHDAEAVRLIREGPRWKILDGRKPRITVIVKY